ncbi:DnaA N-terminal domain-containing protein [Tropicibacter sp. Alg240-R139]|uniref:DnaA N-terminal domain-containing protein n=1 Tax=Tropicibacter sp. Alg240-R139 TaxID=2305991 RepID=UPI0013DF020D|nr:DnaA N-terminal domain-containing protein [Tropicibacter sp. Alg240-R139]
MQVRKPVGNNASALKYDILSALGVHALAGDKHRQRLVLRLMTLITTRYNWRSNELSMGREEISRLWTVNERTVKRDMAKLRALGWLAIKRAGVRGRVTVYELDLKQILGDTREAWCRIGPDFQERIEEPSEPSQRDNVVPIQSAGWPLVPQGKGVWAEVQKTLHARDPELWSSWFQYLEEVSRVDGEILLSAPSRFMADYITSRWSERITAVYTRLDSSVQTVRITALDT